MPFKRKLGVMYNIMRCMCQGLLIRLCFQLEKCYGLLFCEFRGLKMYCIMHNVYSDTFHLSCLVQQQLLTFDFSFVGWN